MTDQIELWSAIRITKYIWPVNCSVILIHAHHNYDIMHTLTINSHSRDCTIRTRELAFGEHPLHFCLSLREVTRQLLRPTATVLGYPSQHSPQWCTNIAVYQQYGDKMGMLCA
jgi:hypothetical protein